MRTTLTLDDELLAEARRLVKISETPVLVREDLTALIERESARRLARLGGSEPDIRGSRAEPRPDQPNRTACSTLLRRSATPDQLRDDSAAFERYFHHPDFAAIREGKRRSLTSDITQSALESRRGAIARGTRRGPRRPRPL